MDIFSSDHIMEDVQENNVMDNRIRCPVLLYVALLKLDHISSYVNKKVQMRAWSEVHTWLNSPGNGKK